jgi:hypothetical protein
MYAINTFNFGDSAMKTNTAPNTASNTASNTAIQLQTQLRDHAALAPPEDRLAAVLALSNSAQKPAISARKPLAWLSALAASVALGFGIFLALNSSNLAPTLPLVQKPADSSNALALAEIAELMADSKALESSLQNIGSSRARISQMQSLSQASAPLALLDSQLDYWVNAEPNNLVKHRALWRERVTVMHAVEKGEFHPALFLVD